MRLLVIEWSSAGEHDNDDHDDDAKCPRLFLDFDKSFEFGKFAPKKWKNGKKKFSLKMKNVSKKIIIFRNSVKDVTNTEN